MNIHLYKCFIHIAIKASCTLCISNTVYTESFCNILENTLALHISVITTVKVLMSMK